MKWDVVFMVINTVSSCCCAATPLSEWIHLGSSLDNHRYPPQNDVNGQNNGNNLVTPKPVSVDAGLGKAALTRPSRNTVTTGRSFQSCVMSCSVSPDYSPVCGTNSITYDNVDRLNCEKSCGRDVSVSLTSRCPKDNEFGDDLKTMIENIWPTATTTNANTNIGVKSSETSRNCINSCLPTFTYRPVCGTDNVTYVNPEQLACVQNCGVNVMLRKFSACQDNNFRIMITTPQSITTPTTIRNWGPTSTLAYFMQACINVCPQTNENNPTCGTNDVTYKNPSVLQCHRLCGIDVELKRISPCYSTQSNQVTTKIQARVYNLDNQLNIGDTQKTTKIPDKPGDGDIKLILTNTNQETTKLPNKLGDGVIEPIFTNTVQETTKIPDKPRDDIIEPILTNTNREPIKIPNKSTRSCIDICMNDRNKEYVPVCGSNNLTYKNFDQLQCASSCGADVFLVTYFQCDESFISLSTSQTTTKTLRNVISEKTTQKISLPDDIFRKIFTKPTINFMKQTPTPKYDVLIDPRYSLKRR